MPPATRAKVFLAITLPALLSHVHMLKFQVYLLMLALTNGKRFRNITKRFFPKYIFRIFEIVLDFL